MAKATGSIRFTGLPDEFSIIEINDGQGLVGSRLKLGWIDDATSSTHQNNAENGEMHLQTMVLIRQSL